MTERRRIIPSVLLAGAIGLTAIGPVQAQCRLVGVPLGQAVLEGLLREPRTLLLQYPHGEDGLRGVTLQLAAAGPDTVEAVRSVITLANNQQRLAIGAGFASAVNTCSRQDSTLVQKIRQAVKTSGSTALQRAYNMTIDTGALDGTPAPAGPAPVVASDNLKPAIGGGLRLPSSRSAINFPDPTDDPAGWH